MDTEPSVALLPTQVLKHEDNQCSPDQSKEETKASISTPGPSLVKIETLNPISPQALSLSSPKSLQGTKQLLVRSSFRPVILPIIQKEIQLKELK
jgi:hypothetical protein